MRQVVQFLLPLLAGVAAYAVIPAWTAAVIAVIGTAAVTWLLLLKPSDMDRAASGNAGGSYVADGSTSIACGGDGGGACGDGGGGACG
jgi:hypothetical protein